MKKAKIIAAVAALGASLGVQAAYEVTIPAPNGIGDVVALTNALAQANALSDSARANARIWLTPGLYNLSGVHMTEISHLQFKQSQHGLIAGLGKKPDDTILLGGGEAENHRIMELSGGGNYGWVTVSNLTVTGGYSSTNGGGGIGGTATTRYSHLIVSNNYAFGGNGGGGGGCSRGRAEYCFFADNRTSGTRLGGAFWTDGGGGQMDSLIQGAWHCIFTNNVSADYRGGALRLQGKCVGCKFFGNKSVNGGAIVVSVVDWDWNSHHFTNTTEILDCEFVGNTLLKWGHGSAIHNETSTGVTISNCVFTANDTSSTGGSGVIRGGNLYDCVVTNNVRVEQILYDCNLMRCLVESNTNTGNAATIDYSSTIGAYTNVNCLFLGNWSTSYGPISYGKVIVNCTYLDNISNNGGNYGGICTKCAIWNTILMGNYIHGNGNSYYAQDVRAHSANGDLPLVMTNCFFEKSDSYTTLDANGYITNEGVSNTRKVSDMKFTDAANRNYTPKYKSVAYNAGCSEPWILELVGDKDLAGNPRVFGEGLDVGAYECQRFPPGAVFTVR